MIAIVTHVKAYTNSWRVSAGTCQDDGNNDAMNEDSGDKTDVNAAGSAIKVIEDLTDKLGIWNSEGGGTTQEELSQRSHPST